MNPNDSASLPPKALLSLQGRERRVGADHSFSVGAHRRQGPSQTQFSISSYLKLTHMDKLYNVYQLNISFTVNTLFYLLYLKSILMYIMASCTKCCAV